MSELTAEEARRLFRYEPSTGKLYWRVSPNNRVPVGAEAGSVNGRGYLQARVRGRLYQVHRVIWLMHHGRWPEEQIDHIDRDPSNNRIENLREVTHQENMQNGSLRSDNTSGFVGVAWREDRNKWRAQVKVDGKSKHLGLFEHRIDAVMAADKARAGLGFHPNHGRQPEDE